MKLFKVLLPLVILSAGALGAWALIAAKPEIEQKTVEHALPAVEVVIATPKAVRLNVHSQGVVAPRTEIDLVSEVSGKVIKVHPAFAAGGFFKAGEVLVGIDPRDYDFSVTRTQAQVALKAYQIDTCAHEGIEQRCVAHRHGQELGIEPTVELVVEGEHAPGQSHQDEEQGHREAAVTRCTNTQKRRVMMDYYLRSCIEERRRDRTCLQNTVTDYSTRIC